MCVEASERRSAGERRRAQAAGVGATCRCRRGGRGGPAARRRGGSQATEAARPGTWRAGCRPPPRCTCTLRTPPRSAHTHTRPGPGTHISAPLHPALCLHAQHLDYYSQYIPRHVYASRSLRSHTCDSTKTLIKYAAR